MAKKVQEISTSPTLGQILTRIRSAEFEQNQEDFAAFLGVDRSTLGYWELDKKRPSRANVQIIIRKLKPWLSSSELAVLEGRKTTKEAA